MLGPYRLERVSETRQTGRGHPDLAVISGVSRSGLELAGPEPADALELPLDGCLDTAQLSGDLGVGAAFELPLRQMAETRRRGGGADAGIARRPG